MKTTKRIFLPDSDFTTTQVRFLVAVENLLKAADEARVERAKLMELVAVSQAKGDVR